MAILTLRNVSKVFGSPDNGLDQVTAINDVSLEVHAGELFSVIGPSGCAKIAPVHLRGNMQESILH